MFRFKQFSTIDDHSTMKVGTDAVLLACEASSPIAPMRILDIGTGCGVIALIMAQKFPISEIDAIDIDTDSLSDAKANFDTSPWSQRLHAYPTALQEWKPPYKYSLIISNPPYFNNSLKSPSSQRNKARHNDTLPYDALVQSAHRLLAEEGSFWCILPPPEAFRVITLAAENGLYCHQKIFIHNKPDSIIKRTLFQLKKSVAPHPNEAHRHIRTVTNEYSEWYKAATFDYYL